MKTNSNYQIEKTAVFSPDLGEVEAVTLEPVNIDMSHVSGDTLESLFARIYSLATVFSYKLYPEDPEELAQQVCANIIRTANNQKGLNIDHLPYYVSCVATNARTDFLRKRKSFTFVSDHLIAETPNPSNISFTVEDNLVFYDIFQRSLYSLTELQRDTFLLDQEGYNNQEIADFYKVGVDVVKSRLYRARQNLQEKLAQGIVQAGVVSNYPFYIKEYISNEL